MAQARIHSRSDDAREARIGGAARVRGRIHGDGALIVEGHVEGDVAIAGELTVLAGASIEGDSVEAESATIGGSLEGDVVAKGPVRLVAGARVRGNLRGSAVSIEEGARFSGRLDCEFDLPQELTDAAHAEERGRAGARR
ncbi:MAG: polymer-forming cytoskeletal protein [Polyangiaceae bacterium]|jgi:cytoskeletal protein CcmA (bactofilin family)